jgi:hypothetical protein
MRSDVPLKVARVGEYLAAVLAGILADFPVMERSMALKAGPPGKGPRTQLALVLVGGVSVVRH